MSHKKRPNETAPIDFVSVLERIGGDESFLMQLIDIYIEDFVAKYELLAKAVKQSDFEAIQMIGHSLKGSSGNLSLNGLYRISSGIELSGKEKDIGHAKILLEQLIEEFATFKDFLSLHFSDPKKGSAHREAPKHPDIKILAADDSVPNQILLQICGAQAGFHMDIANNGREAVELCKNQSYSIIFLDIHMPEVDGFEALNLIRKHEFDNVLPRTPIIALTGSTFQEKGTTCLDAGFDDFVEKSSFQSVLNEMVNKHVQNANVKKEKIILDETLLPLIPEYLRNRKKDIQKIKKALDNNDFDKIEDLGHKMKGSGKCYGFEKISMLGHQIEVSAKEKKSMEIKRSLVQMQDYMFNLYYE
jgi:CheY-like chemotaxis protein